MIYLCSIYSGFSHIFYDCETKSLIQIFYAKKRFKKLSLVGTVYHSTSNINPSGFLPYKCCSIRSKEYNYIEEFDIRIAEDILLSKIVDNFR